MYSDPTWVKNVYWLPTIIFGKSWNMNLDKRNKLLENLNKKNISVRPIFYPVSSFPMYKDCPENIISQRVFLSGVNLPSYFEMNEDDVIFVVENIKRELNL